MKKMSKAMTFFALIVGLFLIIYPDPATTTAGLIIVMVALGISNGK